MTENKRMKKAKKKSRQILIIVNLVLWSVLIFIYLYFAFYYKKHFYTNTIINGVNTSNMTVKEAEEAINAEVKSYVLLLEERNDMQEQITGTDIDLHTIFKGSLEELIDSQNSFAWPVTVFRSRELDIDTMIEYNEDMLKKRFNNLNCFKEEYVLRPANAYISEYTENGYVIIPEDNGALVKKKKLYEAIKTAINTLEPVLSLEEADCYIEAKIKSDHPKLVEALDKMNKIVSSNITYEFGDEMEIVDGNMINEWLSVDDKFKVTLSTDGIKEFVDYIGKTYNTFGKVRTFQTSYGDILQIKGGDYGWWLNRGEEVKELKKMILEGKQEVKEPVYFQTAQHYGSDDVGNTYVEINLTAQHLFFYKDGKLIVEADIVSGNISKNYGTPVGTYPIQYKENDATLNGEDYSTPVKYWMPFFGNIGLHDASWRREFGKDIYLKRGSHGCINMPPAAAKKVFEHIKRGIPVVVYELPGTENYKKKSDIIVD